MRSYFAPILGFQGTGRRGNSQSFLFLSFGLQSSDENLSWLLNFFGYSTPAQLSVGEIKSKSDLKRIYTPGGAYGHGFHGVFVLSTAMARAALAASRAASLLYLYFGTYPLLFSFPYACRYSMMCGYRAPKSRFPFQNLVPHWTGVEAQPELQSR
jgi:hypothetical protein